MIHVEDEQHDLNHEIYRRYCGVKEKEEKGLVIIHPDAVGRPGAVVVHSVNAGIADTTVVGSLGFPQIALAAFIKVPLVVFSLHVEGRFLL